MFKKFLLSVAGILLLASPALAAAPAPVEDIVIHAGHLIDGVSKEMRGESSIIIHGDRIVAVKDGFITPAGARVIDLSQQTVLPGLIDAHVHLAAFSYGHLAEKLLTMTPADIVLHSIPNLKATLEAGFTSVRDLHAPAETSIALKRAVNDGVIEGPRMWVAGLAISPTGGHTDPANGWAPAFALHDIGGVFSRVAVIDGPDDAARAVRMQKMFGADLIKLMVSGGVMSLNDDPHLQLMSDAEIKSAVDTAHALGMKVAAHDHGLGAINAAVRLGVDSIEHGSFADASSYALMKAHGTYLVPTLSAGLIGLEYIDKNPGAYDPRSVKKARMVAPIMMANLAAAYKAGVKIAFGTDIGHGPSEAREFVFMVQAGMTPMDAIRAATTNAADLIGASGDIGSVQVGRYGDIVAVAGNPLKDISILQHVDFVMKGGKIVVSHLGAGGATESNQIDSDF